ncbi:uncharacterized protein K444DRAFT_354843 [Hyaloscypha bicolor E]|uniref:Uncharacterized protein n=1 Tax=Hyaloscypha bicolor E TaxID=1095630 RepID=A0A2J6TIV4_9HELO|nr:uncharacterized protein K444DRAFT_354843 [Hyaloscypha bicolor E]PMD62946.1 hypothetical protein K444DRAFT_354843 [Hyaloscypha bicolor E]
MNSLILTRRLHNPSINTIYHASKCISSPSSHFVIIVVIYKSASIFVRICRILNGFGITSSIPVSLLQRISKIFLWGVESREHEACSRPVEQGARGMGQRIGVGYAMRTCSLLAFAVTTMIGRCLLISPAASISRMRSSVSPP